MQMVNDAITAQQAAKEAAEAARVAAIEAAEVSVATTHESMPCA
jgi:hypothetical protein